MAISETTLAILWAAIIQVESSGNPGAYNPHTNARGIAQITPICVQDINRILALHPVVGVVWNPYFNSLDAYHPGRARTMFDTYLHYYGPVTRRKLGTDASTAMTDYELLARLWNGGPRGPYRKSTLPYWRKVKALLPPTKVNP